MIWNTCLGILVMTTFGIKCRPKSDVIWGHTEPTLPRKYDIFHFSYEDIVVFLLA